METPVAFFMDDLPRTGYHDTHGSMKNIDLDYGAAVGAIAIVIVARCAVAERM